MRRHHVFAVSLFAVLSIAIVTIPTTAVHALAVTNACKSNATGTYSDLSLSLDGSAAPDPAAAGTDTITLSSVTFQASVPATLLIAGYNLGLLTVGSNNIPVKGWIAIQGTNTQEGINVQQFTATVATTITDPNGIPGTGDETATPLSVSVSLGNSTWTPTGGNVAFRQAAPGSLPTIAAGQVGPTAVTPIGSIFISAQVAGGLIKANFDCQPGSSSTDGKSFTPASATDFKVVTVTGGVEPSSTTTTTAATTTTAETTTTTVAPTTTVPAGPATGQADYATDCTNSVTPDHSALAFTASGVAPAQVTADQPFTVTSQAWKVTIPASVFQSGLNLSLLTPGQIVHGTLDIAISASNTAQGTQTAAGLDVTVPVAVDDAGQALPATIAVTLPDMTWTALSGPMQFRFSASNVSVSIGLPNPVTFSCRPTATTVYLESLAVGDSNITTTSEAAADLQATATTSRQESSAGFIVATGTNASLLVQALIALLLLDLGYLVFSLLRTPRRQRSGR